MDQVGTLWTGDRGRGVTARGAGVGDPQDRGCREAAAQGWPSFPAQATEGSGVLTWGQDSGKEQGPGPENLCHRPQRVQCPAWALGEGDGQTLQPPSAPTPWPCCPRTAQTLFFQPEPP